jgi:hypothetical protein
MVNNDSLYINHMFVYVISAEINDIKSYKIGYTKRTVADRIKEFKTGNASEFSIELTFESTWCTKIEAALHKQFRSKKINGEWFHLDNNDLIEIEKSCNRLHNSFDAIKSSNTWYIDRGYKLY